jgi:hypothetical protein
MIDLQSFCGDDTTREFLSAPFRAGGFVYASNGHIIVRVADRAGVADLRADIAAWFKAGAPLAVFHADARFAPPPLGALDRLPRFDKIACILCQGERLVDGRECFVCDGYGFDYRMASVSYAGVAFNARYMRLVLELPGAELARPVVYEFGGHEVEALPFRFTGGIGALCSLRSPYDDHLGDLEAMA